MRKNSFLIALFLLASSVTLQVHADASGSYLFCSGAKGDNKGHGSPKVTWDQIKAIAGYEGRLQKSHNDYLWINGTGATPQKGGGMDASYDNVLKVSKAFGSQDAAKEFCRQLASFCPVDRPLIGVSHAAIPPTAWGVIGLRVDTGTMHPGIYYCPHRDYPSGASY